MIALLTAIYMIFYLISSVGTVIFGPLGHAISPGLCALISGSVLVFMSRKIGKFGQFTIMTAILMLVFSLMGAGYLPWLITSMVAAVIADLIASRSNKTPIILLAIASGILHVGQAWGSIIPSWFFVESYKEEWIGRGQSVEDMEEMLKYTQGAMGIVSTLVVFALAFVGIYIGYAVMKKHLKTKED